MVQTATQLALSIFQDWLCSSEAPPRFVAQRTKKKTLKKNHKQHQQFNNGGDEVHLSHAQSVNENHQEENHLLASSLL